jgi:hypothetical protein
MFYAKEGRNMKKLNKKNFPVGIAAVILAVILLFSVPNANATRLVYPDDPYWGAHIMSNGEVAITPTNPRNGNGSLELSTTGDLSDWAFYTRYADDVKRDIWAPNSDITTSWGLLSDISNLSFDWYRKEIEINNPNLVWYDPFHVQTPVLRLLIRDGNIHSELVWERFYTDSNQANMIFGEWVEEDLIVQNFWRHTFYPVSYTNEFGDEVPSTYLQTLLGLPTLSWAEVESNYYSENAVVYGLSVGVGSYWPANYLGYADTVYLAFNGSSVIDDNFEFPVPEPSTLLLLLSGMAALSVGRIYCGKLCRA